MQSSKIRQKFMKDKTFIGCFPFDKLPAFPEKLPAKLIINTGASSTEGEHWVALLLKPKSFTEWRKQWLSWRKLQLMA